ncbi:MAG: rod shape-determining protein MreD [Cyanobacteria bacterium]|nr:rod shape-determining protein MreD [Cyanobacteriota bacterium]
MGRLHRQPICVASALLVPMTTLATPSWLGLDGVPPSWAVLWLLPWALVDGPVSGALAGVAIGLVMDGLNLGGVSQVPALLLLGWWWGRLGRRAAPVRRTLNLGLLAWLGSMLLGGSLLAQLFVLAGWQLAPALQSWGWHTLWCQALVTGLMAPIVVSLQLLLWRRRVPS